MVIYEVTAIPRDDLCEAYESFMCEKHIPEVLATGFFTGADFERAASGKYRVRYFAADRDRLEMYLETATHALRDDFSRHFPEGIELMRDEWTVVQAFA